MAALPAAVLHDRQHIREATYCFQIPPTYNIIAYNGRCTMRLTSYWAARHPSSTATTTITVPAPTAARLTTALPDPPKNPSCKRVASLDFLDIQNIP